MALSNVARVEVWRLIGFASTDIGIAGKVASLPWFLDGVHGGEQHALDALEDIASQDVELARLVTSAPWLEDGITSTENNVLRDLRSIALTDIEVATKAKRFLWLYDTITDGESDALRVLKGMASEDPELARMVASLHWFVDDVDRNENSAIAVLTNIAPLDRELARLVIASPWFDDGITSDEVAGLRSLHFFFHALRSIEAEDPELPALATALPWSERGWDRDLYRYFLSALASAFQKYGADAVGQLIVQPWFADGLSEEEAVLVVILAIIEKDSSLYRDLLKAHHTQTRTVSLPLAGDVNIWVIQPAPFPPDDDVLTILEDTARIMEGFLEVPFPTTDIILLVADQSYERRGYHAGSYMKLTRYDAREVAVPSVLHETAHYYFGGVISGTRWLIEGGAEFIEAYITDLTDGQDLKERRVEVSKKTQRLCADWENIRHYIYGKYRGNCHYFMGENLLHALVETMGEVEMRAALHELHELHLQHHELHLHLIELSKGLESYDHAQENLIYLTFLKHTPSEKKEAFRNLYRRLHGGPYEDRDTVRTDDHGDEASVASDVQVGDIVEGTLDYMWDFDYFRFQAEAGQVYWINVNHETLRSSSISMYGPDGQTEQGWMLRDRVSTGPRMLWEAQNSGEHYFAVQNFGGKTGQYTLMITPLVTNPDDHGDTPATATDIPVKGVVKGSIDHGSDIDIFRIQAVEGRWYSVGFRLETLEEGTLIRYSPKVVDRTRGRSRLKRPSQQSISWSARATGEYFYIIVGYDGAGGTYTLKTSGGNEPNE